jgi:O-antigen/teichoic acid export membrane protein
MRLITSFVSYPLFLAVIAVLHPGDKVLFIVAVLQGLGMIFQTSDVLVYWFRIKLKMKFVSIAMVVAITVTCIIRAVLLLMQVTVGWFALAISIQGLVAAVIITAVFIKKSDVKLKVSMADARALLRISYNCIISSMSIIIYMQADKIILEKMTDSAHVGIYSAAVMLATCWQFVPSSLIDSARPVVLEKRKASAGEYLDRFKLVMAGANVVSFVFALLMSGLGWVFIHFVYGNEYMDAVIPLIILSWASFFAMTGYVRSIWITGEGFYRFDKIFTVTAAVLDIVLDIVLIWKFGIIGAALATLVTYVYEVLIVPLFFKETRVFPKLYFQSFRMIPRFSKETLKGFFRKFG